MHLNASFIIKSLLSIVCLFFYCEWLIYYVYLYNCDWPLVNPRHADPNVVAEGHQPVRIMVLADTHLLGSRNGHWFDKLRREWQMYRAFQTALTLHRPDLVFVLGDLTDEGHYCGEDEFNYYVRRFRSLFAVPNGTQMYVTVGNHDIGFHYRITPYLNQRFVKGFNSSSVQLIMFRGVHFVLMNSMALEGDGCKLCRDAEIQLVKIEKLLNCAKNFTEGCDLRTKSKTYSRPILMQHFPLYRVSDEHCNESDEAPFPLKQQKFREGWDCLSRGATDQLLKQLKPRLVMSGHTHHGCTTLLPNENDIEITLPSFSWRNKNNPTYRLIVITPNDYAVSKCFMPEESTVITTYIIVGIIIVSSMITSLYLKVFYILRVPYRLLRT